MSCTSLLEPAEEVENESYLLLSMFLYLTEHLFVNSYPSCKQDKNTKRYVCTASHL